MRVFPDGDLDIQDQVNFLQELQQSQGEQLRSRGRGEVWMRREAVQKRPAMIVLGRGREEKE